MDAIGRACGKPVSPSVPGAERREPRRFETTRWSLVFSAARPEANDALSTLCRLYWRPVYAFIRSLGVPRDDAEDVTQGFFVATLVERNDLTKLNRQHSRFRAWLKACAHHYVCNWFDRGRRLTTGGRAVHVDIDAPAAERWLHRHSTEQLSPDKLFDRAWALQVLELAGGRLHREYARKGREALVESLGVLPANAPERSDAELCRLLGVDRNALRVARHRMIHRDFGRATRAEVGETVSEPEQIETEIRFLLEALE